MNDETSLQQSLKNIEKRNRRVEANKAWETSRFRVVSICILTYVIALIALFVIDSPRPVTGALIPMIGFFLSTQTIPVLKRWWIKKHFPNTPSL
ncbi:MAG: hypothetical protein AAB839_01715 [Patescibacteria group bacterium]